MKRLKRPGFLSGHQGLIPRATRNTSHRKMVTGLGAFGKGVFVPVPNAPAGAIPIDGAIDASTGQPYMQDPRCPEGEKMVQKQVPCEDPTGMDPCDPGEFEIEDDCEDDPAYQQKPEAPAPVAQQLQPIQQQAAPNASDAGIGPTTAQEAELERLTAEAAETDAMVTSAPALAPPSAYTGGGMPSYIPPQATRPRQPTEQQKLMDLVQEYQSQRPATPRVIRSAPRPSAPPPAYEAPSSDIFSWLRGAIFGTESGMDGWTDSKLCKYGIPTVALLTIGYILIKRKTR